MIFIPPRGYFMIIYHGSPAVIERPQYGIERHFNDFGSGFYCTQDIDIAREWAVGEKRDGYVNQYEIDLSQMNVIDLNAEGHSVLHWVAVLLQNRRFDLDTPLAREAYRYLTGRFGVDLSNADAVCGYRADDSCFSFARDLINGEISIRQLSDALKQGDCGRQIVIRSRKAFDAMTFAGCEGITASEYYPAKIKRDLATRKAYSAMDKDEFRHKELYMVHIIEEEVGPDDPRLQ